MSYLKNNISPSTYHKIYGVRKARIKYRRGDFIDYILMTFFSACIIYFSFGFNNLLTKIGIPVCGFMGIIFAIRHGIELRARGHQLLRA